MNSSDCEEETMRARIRYLVAEARDAIIGEVGEALQMLRAISAVVAEQDTLSPSRLNALRNTVSWHEARPGAEARLRRLDVTLRRLHDKASGRPEEQVLYLRLRRMIWPEPDPVWLALEKLALEKQKQLQLAVSTPFNIFERLQTSNSARWEAEARLQLAAVVLDTLTATVEIRPLKEQITARDERNAA